MAVYSPSPTGHCKQGLCVSSAETHCRPHCDCQDLACLLCGEVGHITWDITSVCSWQIDYVEALTPPWNHDSCFVDLAFFSGYGIAVPVQSGNYSLTFVVPKMKPYHVLYFLDHLKRSPSRGLIDNLMDVQCSLPSVVFLSAEMAFSKINLTLCALILSTQVRRAIWSPNCNCLKKDL